MTEHPTVFRFVASTGAADRNGNVLDIDGWELENYRSNPVVLFNHNWDLPPVGRATRLQTEGDRLLAQVEFAPTPLGQELALLNADGYLRAISVGVRPLEWEVRRDPSHGYPIGIHCHRQELLELSIVAIPANPATVRAAVRRGAPIPELEPWFPNLPQAAVLAYLPNHGPSGVEIQRPAPTMASAILGDAYSEPSASASILERLQAINARLRS